MCGIFALLNVLNTRFDKTEIYNLFMKGQKRGPENTRLVNISEINNTVILGFHRLAINGYDDTSSNQPFHINNTYLICNGEIYNHKTLYEILKVKPKSKSDCEVIIHMYNKYGIEQTLQLLDGVFAFILIDTAKQRIFVARDTYGVRPLFTNTMSFYDEEGTQRHTYAFASEMKSLCFNNELDQKIKQFEPGSLSIFEYNNPQQSSIKYVNTIAFSTPNSFCNISHTPTDYDNILRNIFFHIEEAVKKRVDNTDREIACLLSGGLDSSIICALVKRHCKGSLHTWSIGFVNRGLTPYVSRATKIRCLAVSIRINANTPSNNCKVCSIPYLLYI